MPDGFNICCGLCALAACITFGVCSVSADDDASTNAGRRKRPEVATKAGLATAYGKLPLNFEANSGHTDGRAKFLSRGRGYTLFLTGNEAVLSLRKGENHQAAKAKEIAEGRDKNPSNFPVPNSQHLAPAVLRMKLAGANDAAKVSGLDELPGKSNYFLGNDPKKWRTDVPDCGKVRYEGVYPGIDLVYYGNQQYLEYDFVVAPGADPGAIRVAVNAGDWKIEGRKSRNENPKLKITIAANGDLLISRQRRGPLPQAHRLSD